MIFFCLFFSYVDMIQITGNLKKKKIKRYIFSFHQNRLCDNISLTSIVNKNVIYLKIK